MGLQRSIKNKYLLRIVLFIIIVVGILTYSLLSSSGLASLTGQQTGKMPIVISPPSVHFVYHEWPSLFTERLWYATDLGNKELIIDTSINIWEPTIAVDSKNVPHVSSYNLFNIYYSTRTSAGWRTAAIPFPNTATEAARKPVIVVDSQDRPHIFYLYDSIPATNPSVYVATPAANGNCGGGSWNCVAVVRIPGKRAVWDFHLLSVAVDPSGNFHVVFNNNDVTEYALLDPMLTIKHQSTIMKHTDNRYAYKLQTLKVSAPDGVPMISFVDSNMSLYFATPGQTSGGCEQGWQCVLVDDNSILEATNLGQLVVFTKSYLDTSNGATWTTLKVADGFAPCSNGWPCHDVLNLSHDKTVPIHSLSVAGGTAGLHLAFAEYLGRPQKVVHMTFVGSKGNCGDKNSWVCKTLAALQFPSASGWVDVTVT